MPAEALAWHVGLRLMALASVAATVGAGRAAVRRLLRTEDALALSLLRERDSARRDRLTRLWNSRFSMRRSNARSTAAGAMGARSGSSSSTSTGSRP